MTDPNAVCRAPARTAARLVARLFCTRPDPVARARSLPFNASDARVGAGLFQPHQRAKATGVEQHSQQTWRQCYLVFLLVCLVSFHSLFLLSLLSLLSIFPPLFSSP